MPTYAEAMQAKRHDTIKQMQARLASLAEEGREATPDEATELDGWEKAVERYQAEAERAHRAEQLAASSDVLSAVIAPTIEAARQERREPTDAELLRKLLDTTQYFDGFDSFASDKRSFHERMDTLVQKRALQSAGGSAIPTTFYDQVTVYERTLIPVLQVATVLETSNGAPIVLPRLTADQSTGGTVTAEAAGILEADPTISSVQLDAYKYAVTTLYSRELDDDNVIGVGDLIARSAARELALKYGAHMTTGDGNSKPNGFITAATNGGTAGGTAQGSNTDTFVSPADLMDLFYFLAAPYRQFGSWMVATTAAAKMRKFRDNNRAFIWDPSLDLGTPDRFNGRPVYENPAMAAVASATKSVAFGDFSRYFVRRMPIRVERSTEYKFANDQVAVKTVVRTDGDLVDTAAIAYLVSANT